MDGETEAPSSSSPTPKVAELGGTPRVGWGEPPGLPPGWEPSGGPGRSHKTEFSDSAGEM